MHLANFAKAKEPVMILPWLILIPFIGGLLCWMGERFGATSPLDRAADHVPELALGLWLWAHGDYSFAPAPGADPTWALEFKHVDPALRHQRAPGPRRPVAADDPADRPAGCLSVLCSWKEIQRHVGFFHLNLMWILGGVVGVFLALDLFMFFFFWEMMLVPMYFLIALWGHSSSDGKKTRIYAATKFFIFTQASGLIMLVAILGLVLVNFNNTGVITFNYADLLKTKMSMTTEYS
jgi:NADH-quinone oxidoreductase subunit M